MSCISKSKLFIHAGHCSTDKVFSRSLILLSTYPDLYHSTAAFTTFPALEHYQEPLEPPQGAHYMSLKTLQTF